MKNDKFLKFILTVIAVCLVLLVMKTFSPFSVANAKEYKVAGASSSSADKEESVLVVNEIAIVPYTKLVSLIPLDNSRTFVATGENGFTVYRLEYRDAK